MAVAVVAAVAAAACTRDDGASVRDGGATGSSAASQTHAETTATSTLGGYEPVSDVEAASNVSSDACDIAGSMQAGAPPDYAAVAGIYARGEHAVTPDGNKLTLRGFATAAPERPLRKRYATHFGDPAWLDTFAESAIQGSGPFAGQSDAVRRQAILTAVEGQIPVAWALDQLDVALEKVGGPGGTALDNGAPHAVDQAWALFHGSHLVCGPYFAASSAGRAFGTDLLLPQALRGEAARALSAARAGDADQLRAATVEFRRLLVAAHIQGVVRAAAAMDTARAGGDNSALRVRQAEGWALFRTIEPLVAEADAGAARTVAGILDITTQPAAGAGAQARTALESTFGKLGISQTEVGTLGEDRGERSGG